MKDQLATLEQAVLEVDALTGSFEELAGETEHAWLWALRRRVNELMVAWEGIDRGLPSWRIEAVSSAPAGALLEGARAA
jgi:hypothetical protein